MFELPDISEIVALALAEDLGVSADDLLSGVRAGSELLARDATTDATIGPDARFEGIVVARQDCVVCGLPAAAEVFSTLGRAAGLFEPVEFFPLVAEGSQVREGTAVAEVDGLASVVLAAERTALDLLMVLSGIATETSHWVDCARGRFDVCDTRKTLPGLRDLSKYAVRVGGGTNHRFGLHDMILVKDNHRAHAGGITAAVGRARLRHPELVIEVEADTIAQAVEAVEAGADLVLLDNMDRPMLEEAVAACRAAEVSTGRRVALELSGNVRLERLDELGETGIDRVSSSALTLAAPVDFALDVS